MPRSPTLGSASAILQEILVTSARVGNNYMMRIQRHFYYSSTGSSVLIVRWVLMDILTVFIFFPPIKTVPPEERGHPQGREHGDKGELLFVSVIYWYPKRASSITTYCDRSNGKVIHGIYIGPRFLTYERPGRWLGSVTDLLRVLAITVLSINHPY